MMMLNHGKDVSELLEQLGLLTTNNKSVLKDSEQLILECKVGEGIRSWTVKKGGCVLPDGTTIQRGTSFHKFQEAVSNLDKAAFMSPGNGESCFVLCHASTTPVRVGKNIISYWYCLPTDGAFYIGPDMQPKFDIIELSFNDWEFSQMMQTKLAFMYEEMIYPITLSAVNSVGSLMDCNSAFKRIDDCQLGSAILLSEKISYMQNLQFVYRESSSKVRPLMALAGGTYVHIPLDEFFRKINDKISEKHLFKAERWTIGDSGATLEMRFLPDESLGLLIKASDLPGQAMSVTAFALVDGCKVALLTNTVEHRGKLVRESIDGLYNGIEEAFAVYRQTRQTLYASECIFSPDLLITISKIIGKKRMNKSLEAGKIPKEVTKMNAWKLYKTLVSGTYYPFSGKQCNDLMKAYKSLMDEMRVRCF